MSQAFAVYLRISSVSGAVAATLHGYKERERRGAPFSVVGGLRDGIVGSLVGPIVAPFFFPIATWQAVTKKAFPCPCTMSWPPSDPF